MGLGETLILYCVAGAAVAGAVVATPLISLALPIVAKWLLLGQVRPGRHPLWGWFFSQFPRFFSLHPPPPISRSIR